MLSWDHTKLALMEYVTSKDNSMQELVDAGHWASVASLLAQDKEDFKNIIPPACRHLETELRSVYNFHTFHFHVHVLCGLQMAVSGFSELPSHSQCVLRLANYLDLSLNNTNDENVQKRLTKLRKEVL